jgi:acid stress-induced BolA-like protein IbaG/YrbA
MAQIIYAQEMLSKLEDQEKKDVSKESAYYEVSLIIQAIREVIPQELQRKLYDKIAEYQQDNEDVIELSDGSEYDEEEEKW